MPGWMFSTEKKETILSLIEDRRHLPRLDLKTKYDDLNFSIARDVWVILNDQLASCYYDPSVNLYILGQQTGQVWQRVDVISEQTNSQDPAAQASPWLTAQRDLDGSCVVVRVFNAFFQNVPGCLPIPCVQDAFGDCYVMDPDPPPQIIGNFFSGNTSTTTSTTSAPSTTTTQHPNPCGGRCKWTWHAAGAYWSQTVNGCALTTTSSSTTTTTTTTTSSTSSSSTSSTTTFNPCNCTSTTPNPNTLTTLPPDACHCDYPHYCGKTDGECTFTYCTLGYPIPNVKCTSTTSSTTSTTGSPTTTCDCNHIPIVPPGTTPMPPGCCPCTYACVNGAWQLVSGPCCGQLTCPGGPTSPVAGPVGTACNGCSSMQLPGVNNQGGNPGKPCFCSGGCVWNCIAGTNQWFPAGGSCSGTVLQPDGSCIPCDTCFPPSQPANCVDCNASVTTGCTNLGGGGNSTTPAPGGGTTPSPPPQCSNCYTTATPPSTTTTTCEPMCGCGCGWQWAGTQWILSFNNCSGSCACPYPTVNGTDASCQTVNIDCRPVTTTTTSSTTTTSTTSTTSTTTTCPALCDNGAMAHYCVWRWDGSTWNQFANNCFTNCVPSPCTFPGLCGCYVVPGSPGSFPGQLETLSCGCPVSTTTPAPTTTTSGPTTTTTTSTTTTSTTSHPPSSCMGTANYIWNGTVWNLVSQSCSGDVASCSNIGCPCVPCPPTTPGSFVGAVQNGSCRCCGCS